MHGSVPFILYLLPFAVLMVAFARLGFTGYFTGSSFESHFLTFIIHSLLMCIFVAQGNYFALVFLFFAVFMFASSVEKYIELFDEG